MSTNPCIDEKKRRAIHQARSGCRCDDCCKMREKKNARSREHYATNREKDRAKNRAWFAANPEYPREYALKQKYGLTSEEYEEMLLAQDGVCAICHKYCLTGRRLAVDHDRSCCPGKKSCGKCIRGLLCSNCNQGLGKFKDSRDLLLAVLTYLEKYTK